MDKLPQSDNEILTLVLVGGMAAASAMARLFYNNSPLHWRYIVGSTMMACFTSVFVYAILANYYVDSVKSGYYAVSIGTMCGLFTEDVISAISARVRKSLKTGGDDEEK